MQPIRQIIDSAPASIPVPAELQHQRVEIIFWPLEDASVTAKPEGKEETDANGWPLGFFQETFGSIPDFPERESQGEYEVREPLE